MTQISPATVLSGGSFLFRTSILSRCCKLRTAPRKTAISVTSPQRPLRHLNYGQSGRFFSDPRDIRWTWVGKGERRGLGDRVYYKTAKVTRLSDKLERTFRVGDTVYVNAGGEEPWVAHLVNMFQRGSSEQDDDEVQVVDDSNSNNSMRCTLRWCYTKGDLEPESLRLARDLPRRIPGEMYFTDHVEDSGSNGLEVIEGRAFLCSTEQEMRNLKENPPKNYWDDDAVRLVRCFYGNKSGSPPPLRELEKGELQHLISKPSTDTHLYRRSRPALFGVTGAVMKGTGSKKHSQAGSNSVRGFVSHGSPRPTTRKSPGDRPFRDDLDFGDEMDEMPIDVPIPKRKEKNRAESGSKAPRRESGGDIDDVPIKRRAQSAKPRHRRVVEFESSDDDSEDAVEVPSPRVRTIRRVIETIEESGRVPSARPKQSKKDAAERGAACAEEQAERDGGGRWQ